MSNRNFDASWVTRRNRDKNVAQQIYGAMQNGLPVGNPMTVNAEVGIITQFNPGLETSTEKNLRPGYSFNLGGIANYVDIGPIGPTATIPDTPVITGAIDGNLSSTITFTLDSDGGSPITSYEYFGTNGLNWIPFTPTSNAFTISGLSVGFSYIVKIRVTNSIGTSNESNTVTINGRTTPGAPTNLTVIPGNGQVLLYFTASSNGNSPITNYQYSTDSGASWLSGGLTSPITISGLLPDGTIYNIILRAVNAIGNGLSSSSVSVASLSSFSPNSISNMNLWLDAQQPSSVILTGGKVSAWNDSYSSGNNFTASASGTINYSFPSGINNRPALNFVTSAPSVSTYLGKDNFNIAPTNQLTVFMVLRQTGNGAGNSELFYTRNNYVYMDIFNNTNSTGILATNIGNATQRSTGVNIITPTTNAVISYIADATVDMFVNGSSTLVSGTARGVLSLNDATLDWAISGGAFLGNIGEVITYYSPLTTTQRQQVEGYLAWKWGTQDSLPVGHPYRNSPPSVTSYTTVGATTWTAPSNITSVQYLVVGGGGGGGGGYDTGGGGGGGGGMILTGTLSVTPGSVYTIEVGAGGSASTNNYPSIPETAGGVGGNSIFASITAYGGDGGKGSRTQTGGSGAGGAVQNSSITSARGGSGGGNAGTSAGGSGGGGGGATGAGANGVSGSGGIGGTGLTSSISGSSITYGVGGSGARGNFATTGASGTANRGNGGDGGGYSSGGARNGGTGGSGIVILKY